ncbi:MAG: repressor LexA, partial [Rhodospirillaceae bacterium]|nr:repressor LexA [Rhodospirillaceae bacterium]
MLTKKQYQLLTHIDERLNDTGISPSYDEMKDALGLKS